MTTHTPVFVPISKQWYVAAISVLAMTTFFVGLYFGDYNQGFKQQKQIEREQIAERCETYCDKAIPLLMIDRDAVTWEARIVDGQTGRRECICALGVPHSYIEQDLVTP